MDASLGSIKKLQTLAQGQGGSAIIQVWFVEGLGNPLLCSEPSTIALEIIASEKIRGNVR